MKFKMAATAGLSLTLDPMGKMFQNASSSHRVQCYSMYCGGGHLGFPIRIKNIKFVENLPMIIPGQFGFNCPSGSWTVETKLPRNDHWKVLYKVSVFLCRSEIQEAATAGHRLTLDPMGKCSKDCRMLMILHKINNFKMDHMKLVLNNGVEINRQRLVSELTYVELLLIT
jgi:hypothetical protein